LHNFPCQFSTPFSTGTEKFHPEATHIAVISSYNGQEAELPIVYNSFQDIAKNIPIVDVKDLQPTGSTLNCPEVNNIKRNVISNVISK
jgi:hypothetical protein